MSRYEGFEALLDYEKDNDSRSRILNSAIYLFSKQGYMKTTTKSIAELAEVSEALVFKLFGNKQSLLESVSFEILSSRFPDILGYKIEELQSLGENKFTIEAFTSILKDKFTLIFLNAGYFKIVFQEMEYNSEDTIKNFKFMIDKFSARLENLIITLQNNNVLRKDILPRTIFRSFIGMMNFLMLDKKFLRPQLDLENELDMIIKLYLRGVEKRE